MVLRKIFEIYQMPEMCIIFQFSLDSGKDCLVFKKLVKFMMNQQESERKFVDFAEKISIGNLSEVFRGFNLNEVSDYDSFAKVCADAVQNKPQLLTDLVTSLKLINDDLLVKTILIQWATNLKRNQNVNAASRKNYVTFLGHLYIADLIVNDVLEKEIITRLASVNFSKLRLLIQLLKIVTQKLVCQSDFNFSFVFYLKFVLENTNYTLGVSRSEHNMIKTEVCSIMPFYSDLLPDEQSILTELNSLLEVIDYENHLSIFERSQSIKYKHFSVLKDVLNLTLKFSKAQPENVYLYTKFFSQFVHNNVLQLNTNFAEEVKVIKRFIIEYLEEIRAREFPTHDSMFAIFNKCINRHLSVIEYEISIVLGLEYSDISDNF